MDIDDRLPGALRDAAGPLPGDVGSWNDLRARGQQVRRRRAGRAGVALATVVALAVGAVVVTRGGDDQPSVVTAKGGPQEVVAAIGGGVFVLDASDGHVIRTLVVAGDDDATTVTATPDGRTVYFQRGEQCGRKPEIWRVPAAGGTAEKVAETGQSPVVSPDGRWLAFAGTANAAPGDCGPFDRLVVMSIPAGANDAVVGATLDFTPTGSVVPLAWNRASDALIVAGNEFTDATRRYKKIGVASDGALTDLGETASPSGNGYEFLPSGEAITAFPSSTTSRIATFDQFTGAKGRVITEVGKPLYLVAADRSGRSFLMEGPLADTPDGSHNLYRVEAGEPEPVKLASRVRAATFVARGEPSAGPDEILAKVDGGLVVLSASTGRVLREVSRDPALGDYPIVSTPAIGDVAYVTIGEPMLPSLDCSSDTGLNPAVAKVDLETGAVTPLLHLAGNPLVSADGLWLAYGAGQGCAGGEKPTLGLTNLVTGENTRPFEAEAPNGPFLPLAWAHDASKLLTLTFSGADGLLVDPIPFDDTPQPVVLPGNGGLTAGAFLPNGRLVVAYAEDRERLSASKYHVATVNRGGTVGRQLFETTSRFPIAQMSVDPSGRLVLVSNAGALAVWAPGDEKPRIVHRAGRPLDVQGAAWMPTEGG